MVPITLTKTDTLSRIARTTRHYGFSPFCPSAIPPLSKKEERPTRSSHVQPLYLPTKDFLAESAHSMISLAAPFVSSSKKPRLFSRFIKGKGGDAPREKRLYLGLYAIGGKDGFTEALLMRAALSALEDAGIHRTKVRINSIGDRDTSGKYNRDLLTTLRAHTNSLPDILRTQIEEDAFGVLLTLIRERHALLETLPRPIEYLTHPARAHFREVVEHLEHNGIPYEIDEWLIGHRDFYAHTMFDIVSENHDDSAEPFVRGGRFDECVKRTLHYTIPATVALLSFPYTEQSAKQVQKEEEQREIPTPHFCLIKVGHHAQVKSISIMEMLRRAKKPFVQELADERLSGQLTFAETCGAPYTIIIGQREAMENAVIVRNSASRAQETVPLSQLQSYILKLGVRS